MKEMIYETPQVEIIEVEVEKGFAMSEDDPHSINFSDGGEV